MQRIVIFLAFCLSLSSAPCRADSWAPAEPQTYHSADKAYRLRVVPRRISDQLSYFRDKAKGREPAGARGVSKERTASATVEHLEANGRWAIVWTGPLTNEVAPVDALIADRGHYVITFDNWHGTGYDSNVVAIYDQAGHLIRQLALDDIVPADFVKALPHSVSSIQWRGTPRLSPDGNLVVPIVIPKGSPPDPDDTPEGAAAIAAYVGNEGKLLDATIRLADGVVLSSSSAEWQVAIAAAKAVARREDEYDEQARKAFRAPLLGPKKNTEVAWHDYLREAFYRTSPDWKDNTTATTVLRDAAAPDYAASEGWLRDDLLALSYRPDTISIASVAPLEVLLARMKAILNGSKPGLLRGVRVFVAAPTATLPELEAIFANTGAKVSCFDPNKPIPQRPERIKAFSSSD